MTTEQTVKMIANWFAQGMPTEGRKQSQEAFREFQKAVAEGRSTREEFAQIMREERIHLGLPPVVHDGEQINYYIAAPEGDELVRGPAVYPILEKYSNYVDRLWAWVQPVNYYAGHSGRNCPHPNDGKLVIGYAQPYSVRTNHLPLAVLDPGINFPVVIEIELPYRDKPARLKIG